MGEQLSQAKEVKGRHQHVCEWCVKPVIEKGEVHMAWPWAQDGSVTTVRMHMDCFEAMDREEDGYDSPMICQDYHRRGMTHDESREALDKEEEEAKKGKCTRGKKICCPYPAGHFGKCTPGP